MLDFLSELEIDYEVEFNQLTDTCCYIGFIIIFIVMVYIQLKIPQRVELEKYVNEDFESKFKLEIKNWEDVRTSLNSFLVTEFGKDTYKDCTLTENFVQDSVTKNYLYVNPPFYRMTFRFFSYVNNDHLIESKYFPVQLTQFNSLDKHNCPSPSENQNDFNTEINTRTTFRYKYTPPGTYDTPYSCGGFVYLLNITSPHCSPQYPQNYTNIEPIFFGKDNALRSYIFRISTG